MSCTVRVIHAITCLVNRQSHATSDFLAAGNGVVAVLERADDKYVRVVPTFPQCGVREDKAHRLSQRSSRSLSLRIRS